MCESLNHSHKQFFQNTIHSRTQHAPGFFCESLNHSLNRFVQIQNKPPVATMCCLEMRLILLWVGLELFLLENVKSKSRQSKWQYNVNFSRLTSYLLNSYHILNFVLPLPVVESKPDNTGDF